MKYHSPFTLIAQEFNKKNIKTILIGGFAINFYNVTRQTADIDLLIKIKDYINVKKIMENAEYKEVYCDKVFARYQSSQLKFMDIDFMFVNDKTLEEMIKFGKKVTIAKNNFTVPSLDHLIALKLHSVKYNKKREYKDLFDILTLIQENKVDVKSENFKKLCLKYGTDALYKKILSVK